MTIKQRLKEFVTAGFVVGKDIYLLRRLVLINTLLLMIIFLFSFFIIYNFYVNQIPTAILDSFGWLLCVYSFYQLRRNQRLEFAINVVVIALFIFLNALAWFGQNHSYTLIWTIFYPIFVLLLKGRKSGLKLVILFYLVLIPQAYWGIGVWQDGSWDVSSFIRFTLASMVIVYSAYFNELSFERSYGELNILRKRERDVAEQRAQLMEDMIERKNQLLAEVSHELRTPLAVLKTNLEALEDGIYDNEEEAYARLHTRLADMNRLIDDLNQVAAADIGALMLQKAPLKIVPLLRDTYKSYQALAADRGIEIALDNHLDTDTLIYADRERLSQVINNLIKNSCRYTDTPGKLQIDALIEGEHVVMRFSDSAPGVREEELPRLFDRLYRVESSRSRATGGSGLGLTICKSLIQAHDGKIAAFASPLGGITIEIRLPIFHA